MATIEGIEVAADAEAVVVSSREPLAVLSSAVVNGGLGRARAILNVHVGRDFRCEAGGTTLAAVARRRGLPAPWLGLLTAAATERAVMVEETGRGLAALVVVTVGLSNAVAAGVTAPAGLPGVGTINVVLVVEAAPGPAAMVNLATTVTEVKAHVLASRDVRCADGVPASGTSTDAVVVAATGRGPRCAFGGPISDLGWVAARAARGALEAGVDRWWGEHR